MIPLALGELYKEKIINKWLKGKQVNISLEEQKILCLNLFLIYDRNEKREENGEALTEEGEQKKGVETKADDKEGEQIQEEEDEDAHFDDWQGVARRGQKGDNSESSESEENNQDDDDDDIDGGLMMPVGAF